jgi:hypothetical protein
VGGGGAPLFVSHWSARGSQTPLVELDVRIGRLLANFPGIAGVEEFVQITGATLGDHVLNLLVHHVFVAGQVVPRPEDADGSGESRPMLHVRE